jgi:lipopolysaccharide/colanic/teichoic acid biosynthesis glycosyltransferase
VGRIPMLTHFRGPSNYAQLMAKRVLDVVCSALALVLLSPLLLGAALLVRASSPGPIFFLQTRVGLHGRQFRMIKFRSMYIDAPQRQAALRQANERDGAAFKMKHDPRITPLGRLLRKFHLDELPQLWNVLVGDMSLVGPRPLPVHESVEHEWWQRRRLTVPPGLTCFWQLQDDPSIPFQQWMRMDMDYIDRWSFWLDLKIIFLTFGTLARGRGW